MAKFLRIAQWNANGLPNHQADIKIFLNINSIDILLITETHFTSRSYFNIPKYKLYHINHPDDTTHGGTAILLEGVSSIRNLRTRHAVVTGTHLTWHLQRLQT
ncbi:hypothetical protein B7P43_G14061 [Cryptotermes secundus]|uniref:Endonuclease/exonuclease/phosphatase domain-containing protein n=1 Tax=Cryptotermes secundus TaxID=105785 RepID=A0A2J7Q451_9NEOP|nr:hypothetical protein B7P43_G14061 [Cryptotermes secundus]